MKEDKIFGPEQRFEERPDHLDVLDLRLTALRQESVQSLKRVEIRSVNNDANPKERRLCKPCRKRFEQRLLGREIVIKGALRDPRQRQSPRSGSRCHSRAQETAPAHSREARSAQFGMLDDPGHRGSFVLGRCVHAALNAVIRLA